MTMTMVIERGASQDTMLAVQQFGTPFGRRVDENEMYHLVWNNVSKQTAGMVTEWAWSRPNVRSLAFDKE